MEGAKGYPEPMSRGVRNSAVLGIVYCFTCPERGDSVCHNLNMSELTNSLTSEQRAFLLVPISQIGYRLARTERRRKRQSCVNRVWLQDAYPQSYLAAAGIFCKASS